MAHWHICRLCGTWKDPELMTRYSVRHWAHYDCGLKKWGIEGFMAKLNETQIAHIPNGIVQREPQLKAWLCAWVERVQPICIYFNRK